MIESLVKWIEENQQRLRAKKVRVSVRRDKKYSHLSFFTAAIAEVETDKVIGNVIFYHTGELDIHIFNIGEKQEIEFAESHEPESEDKLYNLLEIIFDKIAKY